MKIRHKTVLAIAAVCSCVCMFCIGFANWSIGTPSSTVTGNISAEDVYYIEFVGVTGLDYGPDGFTGGQYKSAMTVTYRVHPANIALQTQNYSITVALSLTEPATIKNNILSTEYISAKVNNEPKERDKSTDNTTFSVTVSSKDLPEEDYNLKIEYTIDFGDGTNKADLFKQYILQPYTDKTQKIGFKFNATITGGAA